MIKTNFKKSELKGQIHNALWKCSVAQPPVVASSFKGWKQYSSTFL